jgi:hypothetical protein
MYDDDGSLNFRDLEDLAVLVERYYSAAENMTIIQLAKLTSAVHGVTRGGGGDVTVARLSTQLRESGLGTVPFAVVAGVAEAVARVPGDADPTAHITLAQARALLGS